MFNFEHGFMFELCRTNNNPLSIFLWAVPMYIISQAVVLQTLLLLIKLFTRVGRSYYCKLCYLVVL